MLQEKHVHKEDNKMSFMRKLFDKTLVFHQMVAKRSGGTLEFVPDYLKGKVQTQPMAYDSVSKNEFEHYNQFQDYVRFRTIELIAEEIYRNNVPGDVVEAGVDYGDCSTVINSVFHDRKMFLYDTFSGFDKRDVEIEEKNKYTTDSFFKSANYFKRESFKSADEQLEFVRSRLKHPENAEFRKGYFPETAVGEADRTFAFVSLDMDLYQPIKSGIEFFYPKLNKGGYIMIHDYNHREFKGIKDAVAEMEEIYGPFAKMPIPDQGGTIVIMKP